MNRQPALLSLLEVDGADLQLDATEALFQLLLHTAEHLVVTAHPDKAVDGNAHLATAEGCVKQRRSSQVEQRRLEAEEHGREIAHGFIVNLARPLHLVAEVTEDVAVILAGITTEVGQRRTLPASNGISVGDSDEPALPLGIDSARSARRLFEMEHALRHSNV